MKTVVTGGTGFIGQRLVNHLNVTSNVDDTIVVLTRNPERTRQSERVKAKAWTPDRAGDWMDVVADADVVIHLAGAGVMDERWSDRWKKTIRDSRVTSTLLISEAMARPREERKRLLVSASAIGIYGMRKDDEVLDESAPHGTDFLARVCVEWEQAAEGAKKAGVRVVHPRIGIVLGPDGGALAKMVPPYKAMVGGPIGDGLQGMSWVHVRDVVRAIAFSIATPDFEGAFNVTAPNPVSMNELASAIGKALHRPSVMRVPAFALKIALGESAEVLLTGERIVPSKLLAAGFHFDFNHVDSALSDIFPSGA